MPRVAIQDFDLGGYRIEKGWPLWIPVQTVCSNPAVFDHPERFDPRRFLGPEREKLEYVGWIFAAGKRVCPGRRLVIAEMKLVCFYLMTLIDIENRHPHAREGRLSFRSGIPFNVIADFDPVFTLRADAPRRVGLPTPGICPHARS